MYGRNLNLRLPVQDMTTSHCSPRLQGKGWQGQEHFPATAKVFASHPMTVPEDAELPAPVGYRVQVTTARMSCDVLCSKSLTFK